jgi:drug/metabolite transporter (DMT)-like permease
MVANLFFMIAITNLELSKVGVFMASAPALSALIAIKLMKQKPSIANWLGIAATSSALAIIALNSRGLGEGRFNNIFTIVESSTLYLNKN